MSDEDDIEEIRKRKMEELRDRARKQQGGENSEGHSQSAERQKQAALKQYLTEGARRRLNTVRMSKPEFAEQAEKQVLALAQSGRLDGRIDEEQMKEILRKLKPDDDGFDIRHR